jgi:hypothetical protein
MIAAIECVVYLHDFRIESFNVNPPGLFDCVKTTGKSNDYNLHTSQLPIQAFLF